MRLLVTPRSCCQVCMRRIIKVIRPMARVSSIIIIIIIIIIILRSLSLDSSTHNTQLLRMVARHITVVDSFSAITANNRATLRYIVVR